MVVLDFLQTLFFATEHGVVSECPVRVAMWSALLLSFRVAMYFLNRILCKCIEGLLGKQSSTICTGRKTFDRRWHSWWSRIGSKPVSCNTAWGIWEWPCVSNVLSITRGLQGGNVLSELDFVCKLLKDYWVHSPPPHVKNFNRRWHLWWSRVCLKPISCNVAWGIVVVCVYCKCAHRYVWVTGWGIASVRCRWQPSSREAQSTHGEVRPDV